MRGGVEPAGASHTAPAQSAVSTTLTMPCTWCSGRTSRMRSSGSRPGLGHRPPARRRCGGSGPRLGLPVVPLVNTISAGRSAATEGMAGGDPAVARGLGGVDRADGRAHRQQGVLGRVGCAADVTTTVTAASVTAWSSSATGKSGWSGTASPPASHTPTRAVAKSRPVRHSSAHPFSLEVRPAVEQVAGGGPGTGQHRVIGVSAVGVLDRDPVPVGEEAVGPPLVLPADGSPNVGGGRLRYPPPQR